MGWIEDKARREAQIYRDGPEIWRNLKLSIRQEVEDYTRIYSPPGTMEIQFADCLAITENCIRVRTVAQPGIANASHELTFFPDGWKIECSTLKLSFVVAVIDESVVLLDKDSNKVSIEGVSKAFLTPILAKIPRRRPNINL